jgi:hypothetical protein
MVLSNQQRNKMIRTVIGFLMVFGSVGGMDNATDGQLIPLLALAVTGLALMYFGTKKINAN